MTLNFSDLEVSALKQFVLSCILPHRQERFLTLLQSKKGLLKWIDSLDHFQNYLDVSNANDLSKRLSAEAIIKESGLRGSCEVFVFSTFNDMRGVKLSLGSALAETFQMGNGSIICPLENSAFNGFYLGEEQFAQYLWMKKSLLSGTQQ